MTPEKLALIEAAENVLRDLGFYEVRVRHHESGAPVTRLARIEIAPGEIPRLLAGETLAQVAGAIRKLGYQHVTLDLQGYRRGSVNEVLAGRGKNSKFKLQNPEKIQSSTLKLRGWNRF